MSVVVLVDGSNVARHAAWEAALQREQAELPHAFSGMSRDPRGRLADWIAAWRTHAGDDVVLVFDGEGPQGAGRRAWDHGFLVIGSGSDSGDAVVELEAARLARERRRFRLVTDDRALASVAGADAEAVLAVEAFVAELTRQPIDEPAAEPGPAGLGRSGAARSTIVDDLDDDTRVKLERMRRGLDPNG